MQLDCVSSLFFMILLVQICILESKIYVDAN